jgi:hypothetical protein
MQRSSFHQLIFLLAGAGLAANVHANPIVNNTVFSENIFIETDTIENPSGSALFTISGVGYSDWLSSIISGDFSVDSTVPSQIRSTVAAVPQVSEYQFLSQQGPDYIVIGAGPATSGDHSTFPDDIDAAFEATGGPGYSITGTPSATTVGQWSYSTVSIAPDGSILEGTVNFDVVSVNIVEQPAAAAPEPATLALTASGLALVLASRKRVGGKQ